MLQIRNTIYQEHFDDTNNLDNTTVILIDPFPTVDNEIKAPENKAENLLKYLPNLIGGMRSQLLFDGKDALEAYRKDNYGLHVVAPSRDHIKQQYAIACGSLGGFGGFLNFDFRVHDYFLGRSNCQSFLRKYFVVNLNEKPGSENYKCISSVIDAYKNNPAARARFEFVGDDHKKWAPIIPDVSLTEPLNVANEVDKLPEYKLDILPSDYLEQYRSAIKNRIVKVLDNLLKGSFLETAAIDVAVWLEKNKLTDLAIDYIAKDLRKRKLMK